MASYLNQPGSLQQEPRDGEVKGGRHVLALYLGALLTVCLFQTAFLEADASLKSMLKSGICFAERKAHWQGSRAERLCVLAQDRARVKVRLCEAMFPRPLISPWDFFSP